MAASADINALDAAVDRIRSHLPAHPYIQTIPQDEPRYHHYTRAIVDLWLKDAPFDPTENPSQQYQTWYYSDHGSNTIHLQVHSQLHPPNEHSADTRPTTAQNKKKISLAAYNNNKKSIAHRTPTPNPTDLTSAAPTMTDQQQPTDSSRKRKRTSTSGSPIKRLRSASPDPAHPLPGRLSPLHIPGRLSPLHVPASSHQTKNLPDRLSPLIVPQTHHSGHHDTVDDDLPSRRTPAHLPLPSPLSPNLPSPIVAALKERAAVKGAPATKPPVSPVKAAQHSPSHQTNTARSIIVKLKIPKRLRLDYRRLLQFPPRPTLRKPPVFDRQNSADVLRQRPKTETDTSLKDSRPTKPPTSVLGSLVEAGKIPRDSSHTSAAKPIQLVTPPPAAHDTPQKSLPSPSSTQDHVLSATRFDPSDTAAAAAPAAGHTPASSSGSSLNTALRPSPKIGSGSNKTTESQAWWTERERIMNLAKTLKKRHAAEHAERAAAVAATSAEVHCEKELAALTNIESFVAFMLGFYCSDTSYARRSPPVLHFDSKGTWCTLHGFWRFVSHACAPWPLLAGIVNGLGMVYNARILAALTTHNSLDNDFGHGNVLKRGGPEEREAVSMLARIVQGPALRLVDVERAFPKTCKAAIETGRWDLPVNLQTPVLDAIEVACALLDEYKPVHGGVFASRLSKAISSSSVLSTADATGDARGDSRGDSKGKSKS